jgi:hypothetical protein
LYAAVLYAEEPPPQPSAEGNLLSRTKWLKLEVVGGRIVVRTSRCSQSRHEAEATPTADSRQTLSVDATPSGVSLRYEEVTGGTRLLFEISPQGKVTIARWGQATDPDIRYVQPPTGTIKLALGGERPRGCSADNLWQLMLLYRSESREQLLPLLVLLRPDWELASQLNLVEAALIQQAGCDVLAQRRQWQREVDGLASPSFARRQAADQALRASGQSVLAFLRQLEDRELDGEQRRRIRTILADLSNGHPDSPPLVADWLVADKRVWLALLARGELDQRVSAADHLSKLCRRALPFDPAGSQEQRSAQLAELTAKLAQP